MELWIYGAGGMGKETMWLCKTLPQLKVLGFLDDQKFGSNLHGLPIKSEFGISPVNMVVSIADSVVRKEIVDKLKSHTIKFLNVIGQNSIQNSQVNMGIGNIICSGVTATIDVCIGNHVIININSIIGHDSIIDDYCTILFGVNISGNVHVGEGTLVGSGATILPNIKIGKWCKIGAGAVVTKDIPDYSVVVGVPGKIIKTLEPDE